MSHLIGRCLFELRLPSSGLVGGRVVSVEYGATSMFLADPPPNYMDILEPGRKPRKAPFLQSALLPCAEFQSCQIANYLPEQPRSRHAYLKVSYYPHLKSSFSILVWGRVTLAIDLSKTKQLSGVFFFFF